MKSNLGHLNKFRVNWGADGAQFIVRRHGVHFSIIASWGEGWDHVSMATQYRCPTWEDMCWLKDQFFEAEETVIQFHPPKSQYVNCHPFCLHLWRPQGHTVELPPAWMVGLNMEDVR